MYVGLTLAYLGEMGILVQVAPILLLLLVIAYVHWVAIPLEETQLLQLFRDAYAEYCKRVPRWV
jgi:protein-S-isoprenylcysteine O-methyltransferase Ste14